MKTNRIGFTIGAFLAFAVLSPTASPAFNKGIEEKGGDPEFKEALRQRQLERDRSKQRLKERERQRKERQGKSRVRIHSPGDDPSFADGYEVVATMELTQEEYGNRDFTRVHAKARGHNRLTGMVGGAEATAAAVSTTGPSAKATSSSSNRTLFGLSLLLVAGGAWWILRSKETAEGGA